MILERCHNPQETKLARNFRHTHFASPGQRCRLVAARIQPRNGRCIARAAADYYSLLGVDRQATTQDIKKAFKKKALKLHPDVNKAADAEVRFKECKQAYEALSSEEKRRDYDRKQQGGGSWDPVGDMFAGAASWQQQQRQKPKKPEEPWYGVSDFLRDVQADWQSRQGDGPPKSLWEELQDLGEEFVGFLEQGLDGQPLGASGAGGPKGAAARGSTAKAQQAKEPPRPPRPSPEQLAAQAKREAEEKAKSVNDEIEEMLRKMKSDLKI